ncbi:CPBP family intramembrane glutamic endopeptidase [Gaoshiqia sediminis]|uniref:CPBP family intramembrane metalloprotease n=1 Tax=Gaoshiqia sediminis TaxID=2986998 RepID=A0AA41Y8J7_9BACT|nr:CPBP family intramembrane glutamic endopeptidase [Gaoshiqia sediminis]MCW0483551.1 CPBP family intramembrane metalloprotease [Gaoshiqia sediminis]
MSPERSRSYPTILGAAHLVILYIFIQTVVDFPLAVWDYYHGTEFLYHPVKKIVLGIGSVVFILAFGYRKAQTSLKELFPAKRFNVLIFIPMTLFLMAAHIFLAEVNRAVDQLIPAPPWFWELFDRIFENDYGFYGAFLKVVVIAPVIEELIFRGIIMHGFMRNYPKIIAIIVSALFFALFHLNPWQFPATFLLGLLLGWIMVVTRNIFACIAGHAINNLLVLLSIEYWEEITGFSFFLLEKNAQLQISYLVAGLSVVLIALIALIKRKR